jgi:hypothetical protein
MLIRESLKNNKNYSPKPQVVKKERDKIKAKLINKKKEYKFIRRLLK